MGTSSQTTNSSSNQSGTNAGSYSGTAGSTTTPGWGPQASALSQIFGQVPTALGQAESVQAPSNFVAGMTPQQLALGQTEANAGTSLASPAFSLTNGGTTAANAGYTGAGSALNALLGYNPSATNNTSNVINGANQYVSGMNIPALVQSDMLGANQEANEVTLPGINQDMTQSGNQNSSRNALAQGLVQSNLAEQAATLGSQLQAQGYNTGAGLTENELQSNNQNALAALTGAMSGGSALGYSGALGSTQGTNNAATAYGLANTGASAEQNNNQLGLQNQLEQYLYGINSPFAPLQGAMGIAGTTNWGPTTNTTGSGNSLNLQTGTTNGTSTTTTSPSLLQMLGSGIGALGAFAPK